jgi:hypothetical protein
MQAKLANEFQALKNVLPTLALKYSRTIKKSFLSMQISEQSLCAASSFHAIILILSLPSFGLLSGRILVFLDPLNNRP